MNTPYLAAARDPLKSREPIPRSLRFAVFERDGFTCRYCGRGPEDTILHADHEKPVSAGGETVLENLVTACALCNLGKGAWLPRLFIVEQRRHAIASFILERCGARDPQAIDYVAVREMIDFAFGCDEPDHLVRIALDEPNWKSARAAMLRYIAAAWPTEDVGDVV